MNYHRLLTIRLLLVLIAIYGLQYFPYTGIFMMFGMAMAGPYIWGFLPHLLTIGMLVDVKLARLPKQILAVPILFYAGYYAFVAYEWSVIKEYGEDLAKANSMFTIAFDAKKHSLVSTDASRLVQQFRLPLAFEPNNNFPLGFLSARILSKQRCDKIRPIERETFELHLFGAQVPDANPSRRVRYLSQCELRNHEAPTLKKLEVTSRKTNRRLQGVNFDITFHDFSLEQRQLGTVTTASANRLPWFPFYIIGCFLNSSKPSWECSAGFHRHAWSLPDDEGSGHDSNNAIRVMARALGLVPYESADYDHFEDYAENALFVDSWLLQRQTSNTSEYNVWGVNKSSPYMPKLSVENGHEHYLGGIYPRKEGGEFLDFVKRNVGKTVQITADIGSGVNLSPTQQIVQIWGVCKNSDACVRTDHAFVLEGAEDNIFLKKRITGFWRVGEFRVNSRSGTDQDTITILEKVLP